MMQVFLNSSPSQPMLLSFTAECNTIAYLETMTFVKFWDILDASEQPVLREHIGREKNWQV